MTVLLALLATAGLTQPVYADPPGPDGSKTDNERLLPGLYPAAPVPEDFAVPAEPGAPPVEIDWSVGLRGTLTTTNQGDQFVTTLSPKVTATHAGTRGDLVFEGSADLSKANDGSSIIPTAVNLGLSGSYALDRDTSISGNAGLTLSGQLPGTPGLNPLIIDPAQVVTGSFGGGVDRRFGQFNLGLKGSAQRTVYGNSTRTDTGGTDNSDQNYWTAGGTLRLGYQATPIFEVFGEAGLSRDMFDLPSASLGVRQDATEKTLRAGVSGRWNSLLTASASVGVAEHDFDDPSLGSVNSTLYDASLTFTPDPTLNITAALATEIAPPGADASGTAKVSNTASANVDYTVNSWLRMRASANWGRSLLIGSGETETSYGAGAGADYKVNAHTALSADYGFGHRNNSSTGILDSHTVSLGITLKR